MKKIFTHILTIGIFVQIANAQIITPYSVKGLKQTYITDYATCISLKASGYDYYSAEIVRDANNKIVSYEGRTNAQLEETYERATSTANDSVIEYLCEIKKPNDGISDFTKFEIQKFYFDATTKLDTTIIIDKYDVDNGTLTNSDTVHYIYNTDNMLIKSRKGKAGAYADLIYNGTLLDSVNDYFSNGGIRARSLYYYTGNTLDSIIFYESDGNNLVKSDKILITQNTSNFTTSFTQSGGTIWKFNEGCTSTTDAIEDNDLGNSIVVYPNPVKDYVYFKNTINARANYSIYNILGGELMTGKAENNSINVSNLNTGTYFLKVEGTIQKLIKE